MSAPDLLLDGPRDAPLTVALAHGAGAAMDSPFMAFFAHRLAAAGHRVARFEFPYMAARRADGRRRPPNALPVLRECFLAVVERLGPGSLVVGGKSLGGRVASTIADEAGVRGLVCLGYPFHPPGRPERTRVDHLRDLRTPALVCQGERDPFGGRDEVAGYALSPRIRMLWLPDGDHGFRPRKSSGRTEADNLEAAVAGVVRFLGEI